MQVSRDIYKTPEWGHFTVDRPKPSVTSSSVYTWDNQCSALDAEWQCLPYAQAACEHTRNTDAYFQCVDARFHACRRGSGCDYTYTTTPSMCTPSSHSPELMFQQAVREVCNEDASKEYASRQSYQACVDRMRMWSNDGCANIKK